MNLVAGLTKTTNPYMNRARRRLLRLSTEQRMDLAQRFERHRKACKSLGVDPDPSWLPEAVDDLLKGVIHG